MEYGEKEQIIIEWMCSPKYIEHIQNVTENIIEAGKWEQVQKLMLKMTEFVEDSKDKDTGMINTQIFIVALFKALIALYIAQKDFEISGR